MCMHLSLINPINSNVSACCSLNLSVCRAIGVNPFGEFLSAELWIKADRDMLHQPYRLQNTGQGLNRVQQCPEVSREMHTILHSVQQRCGGQWVGLSVIHLGDRDVPNALTFIDKYTQVPRILAPIISCVERLGSLAESANTSQFIKLYGGAPLLKMQM